jgi:hypothetical protein
MMTLLTQSAVVRQFETLRHLNKVKGLSFQTRQPWVADEKSGDRVPGFSNPTLRLKGGLDDHRTTDRGTHDCVHYSLKAVVKQRVELLHLAFITEQELAS